MAILYSQRNFFINKSSKYKILSTLIIHEKTYKDLLVIWAILSIIILDRGCPEFADLVFNNFPDIKKEMEGFVYYYNTATTAP